MAVNRSLWVSLITPQNSQYLFSSISNSDEWFLAWKNCNYSAWPMSIAFLTCSVGADDFYRVSFP